MGSIQATIEVEAPHSAVYSYLRNRYAGEVHRSVSLSTKGYVPDVRAVEDDGAAHLVFSVPSRDPLLRIFLPAQPLMPKTFDRARTSLIKLGAHAPSTFGRDDAGTCELHLARGRRLHSRAVLDASE